MNVTEFSQRWDLLYNNIASNSAPGLDEYEKSVFLTQAQQSVVLSLYSNASDGFEASEIVRKYLSRLVKPVDLLWDSSLEKELDDTSSLLFKLPDDLMFIVYECILIDHDNIECDDIVDVVPVKHDEYMRIRKNPFRGPTINRALRLDTGYVPEHTAGDTSLPESYSEIIVCDYVKSHLHVKEIPVEGGIANETLTTYPCYRVRYIRKPNPIILDNFGSDTIEGKTGPMECELPETLHDLILKTAISNAYEIRPQ